MARLAFNFLNTILITILWANTYAFTLNNSVAASFDMEAQDEIAVNVADHGCTNIDLTNDQFLSIIEEAVDTFWNRVHTSSLRLKKGGVSNVSTDFQTGLICTNPGESSCSINPALSVSSGILISCNTTLSNFTNNSVLAVSVPNNVSNAVIRGALILINDDSGNTFNGLSRTEKVAVIAHEIGHAIGLGHTELEDNLMLFESIPTRNALGWDDIDGVTYLYPVEQPISGCGSISTDFSTKGPGGLLPTLLFGLILTFLLCSKKVRKGAPLFLTLFLVGIKKIFFFTL